MSNPIRFFENLRDMYLRYLDSPFDIRYGDLDRGAAAASRPGRSHLPVPPDRARADVPVVEPIFRTGSASSPRREVAAGRDCRELPTLYLRGSSRPTSRSTSTSGTCSRKLSSTAWTPLLRPGRALERRSASCCPWWLPSCANLRLGLRPASSSSGGTGGTTSPCRGTQPPVGSSRFTTGT